MPRRFSRGRESREVRNERGLAAQEVVKSNARKSGRCNVAGSARESTTNPPAHRQTRQLNSLAAFPHSSLRAGPDELRQTGVGCGRALRAAAVLAVRSFVRLVVRNDEVVA